LPPSPTRPAAWGRRGLGLEDAERLRERLRLANAECERLASMADGWWHVSHDCGERGGRELLYRLGAERFTDRVLVAWARSRKARRIRAQRIRFGICSRPCPRAGSRRPFRSSRPLHQARRAEGAAARRAIRAAEQAWIAADFPGDKAAIERLRTRRLQESVISSG